MSHEATPGMQEWLMGGGHCTAGVAQNTQNSSFSELPAAEGELRP